MGKLKWKRVEPGHYQSGDWHAKGTGTNWDLYRGRKHVHCASSKKECQQYAETGALDSQEVEPAVAPKRSPKTDLDSVLASLRLEIDQLSLRVGSMEAAIRKDTESRDGLTKAVLLLGRHVGKLAK